MRQRAYFEQLEYRRLLAGPLVISAGGTYSGTWESFDPAVPAVVVSTIDPVVIENSIVRGRGDLIVSGTSHTNITVRNTSGFALNPNVAGLSPGHFFSVEQFDSVRLENNYLEGTRGINLLNYAGDFSENETVRIVRNKAKNIDGRKSDGNGGWLDFNHRTRLSDGFEETGYRISQFVQLDKVLNLGGIEISGNFVLNEPGNSRVEDVISIYKSSGTPDSPISIRENYIQGAYTIKPWQKNVTVDGWSYDWGFSGGGIMLGDGEDSDDASRDAAFVRARDNVVIDTTNYGVALSAGHDLLAHDNRILSTGRLEDGRFIAAQNVGLYIWDSYGAGPGRFFNNSGHDNLIRWHRGEDLRNDWWIPDAAAFTGNIHWPEMPDHVAAERARWEADHPDVGPRGTLAGIVHRDADGDGIRATGDEPARGVELYLDLDGDGVRTSDEPIVRTTHTGRYTFANVPGGNYTVRLLPVDGWRASKGSAAKLSVGGGGVATRYFAVTTLPLITGTVYHDFNGDGGFNGAEAGMPGWQLWADLDRDAVLDPDEPSTFTNRFGRYALTVPSVGRYEVRVVGQSDFGLTSPGAGYRGVTLSVGEVAVARNFGQLATA